MSKALKLAAVGAGAVAPTYVDDVFSTYLHTGNGSTQTITNGIDLSAEGGLVWIKCRSDAGNSHNLFDTLRGATKRLFSNLTSAESTGADTLTAFNADGFSVSNNGEINESPRTYASWTFRKAPKFFDVVTFTANGSTNQRISHSLGVAPGCIFVKQTNGAEPWFTYHRSLGRSQYLVLNTTDSAQTLPNFWGTSDPTASDFGVSSAFVTSGDTYVAYVFAHDTATDGLIQCGTYTGNGTSQDVALGWEPQFVIIKPAGTTGPWTMLDVMRGFALNTQGNDLFANASDAENTGGTAIVVPYASGFYLNNTSNSRVNQSSISYIYIAIRRPNKPPTVGTQVFGTTANSNNIDTSTPVTLTPAGSDLWVNTTRTGTTTKYWLSRLTGWLFLQSDSNAAEAGASYQPWSQKTQSDLYPASAWWSSSPSQVNWFFKRAPGFFDVVCYAGTGSNKTESHGLGAIPELVVFKVRSGGVWDWGVYCSALGLSNNLYLNQAGTPVDLGLQTATPTASVLNLATSGHSNGASKTYVAYLFSTLAGISKVGSYTGNGSSQTINCGFTTGARFVLIKRTNTTGDWFVWGTARGIVSGNDPHLSLNTSSAEVTTDDSIDPDTTGFVVNQLSATNVNVNAATYIFLAIA